MKSYPCRDGQNLPLHIIGQGQPVVLLHGLGASGRQWLPFIWPFVRQFRFYIPDLRAMGQAADIHYNQDDIFQNHMEDLEDLVEHFQLEEILLGGHSLGNTISLHWQAQGGFSRVKHYLHIDQSPCVRNQPDWPYGVFGPDQPQVFAALESLREILAAHKLQGSLAELPAATRYQAMSVLGEAFARVTGQALLAPLLRRLSSHPRILERRFPVRHLQDLDKVLASYLQAHDYRDSLRDCSTPSTLIMGMRSPLYDPQGQQAMAELMPAAQAVPFSRSGHMPPFQQPVKFMQEFRRFLQQADAQPVNADSLPA